MVILSTFSDMSLSEARTTVTVSDIKGILITFAKCWSALLFVLGIVGHSLSVYVFTRRTLRSNPCARYFLASTIVGYFIVCGTIPIRLLQLGYNIDIFLNSSMLCKSVSYILAWARYPNHYKKQPEMNLIS
jgi:hypothetical protein